ncbi:GNAT family N-acetyltransferase [Streptomyces sp. NBC_01476]|uniref:GNAT family N-acetyltransferase n=1 Tax=Streptomyces sp. NBC_01476 TaxID=2903881 RepID=UPI002E36046F|nr:GNAT family N-acetyltransferase [Streptomyces sp. NBC_01476]
MQVSPATEADTNELSVLLAEIEQYYGGDPVPGDPDQIRRALFSPHPAATVLLARDGDEILGLASYSFLWPAAGADTSLYLKELYVRESARRGGVARALMTELLKAAADAGCSRIEWTADTDNPAALAFYEALGAEPRKGKVFYRSAL